MLVSKWSRYASMAVGPIGTHKWDGPTGIHKWLRILKKGGLSITERWISKYSRVILVRSATWTRMC